MENNQGKSKQITFNDLNNSELAEVLTFWMADASNSWDRFKDNEKYFFRQLQDEVCRRFIEQNH